MGCPRFGSRACRVCQLVHHHWLPLAARMAHAGCLGFFWECSQRTPIFGINRLPHLELHLNNLHPDMAK